MELQIRFCRSADGTRIAYVVLGEGPGTPVVMVNSWVFNIEMIMNEPAQRLYFESLTKGRRALTFDRRGVGSSQRDVEDFSLEANVADLSAVVGLLNAPRIHLVGHGDGARTAAAYAAQNPERVDRLVLFSATVGGGGPPDGIVRLIRENWSWARRVFASVVFPSGPAELQRWLSSHVRQSMSPEVAIKAVEAMATLDLTDVLPRIQSPTLVIAFRADSTAGGEVAALIPDARLLRFPGDLASMWENDDITRAMTDFVYEGDPAAEAMPQAGPGSAADTGTAIILFADIADSTALTERLGDAAFRAIARDLDTALRAAIREHSGTCIDAKTLGDGVLATFASASQAIAAALACEKAGEDGGLPLHLGLHAGDVIREENNVFGGAVNIAARVSALATPGEVLVSETIRSLARTSAGVRFEDRGEREMKGVGEPVRVWAVASSETHQ